MSESNLETVLLLQASRGCLEADRFDQNLCSSESSRNPNALFNCEQYHNSSSSSVSSSSLIGSGSATASFGFANGNSRFGGGRSSSGVS